MNRPTDQDLLDLALGRLDAVAREEVASAVDRDRETGRRYRAMRAHLTRWAALEESPPPPAFARIATRLEEKRRQPRLVPATVGWLGAAAAVGVVALALWLLLGPGDALIPDVALGRAGAGLTIQRAAGEVPSDGLGSELRPGDVLLARAPAEAKLGAQGRVVLDGGTKLVLEGGDRVRLERGRAFFEVAKGPFLVATEHGDVAVVGTAFEVTVLDTGLSVRVEKGIVNVGGQPLEAGFEWSEGERRRLMVEAGTWFRRPQIRLALPSIVAGSVGLDEVSVVFVSPGMLPVEVPGPDPVRTSFWLEVEAPDGRILDLPLARMNGDGGRHAPGRHAPERHALDQALRIAGGAEHTVKLALASRLFDQPGVYRCRAMYRPESRPPLLSEAVLVEVR